MLPLRNLGEKLVHVSPPGLVPVVLGGHTLQALSRSSLGCLPTCVTLCLFSVYEDTSYADLRAHLLQYDRILKISSCSDPISK